MKVLMTGSHGLIGRALVSSLVADGSKVIRLVRPGPRPPGSVPWDPEAGSIDESALAASGPFDAVVHLAGAGIGDHRWNAARRQRIVDSRVGPTTMLASALGRLEPVPPVLVSASAIGFYGDRGDELLDESSGPGAGFLAGVCRDWEAATAEAVTAGIRVVALRTGIVLSADGGALAKQLSLFRKGLGGRLGDGRQWMSWITLGDEVAVIRRALEDQALRGPVNATGPGAVTNGVFTRSLAAALGRPSVLGAPKAALRLALGKEMADELVLASQRVRPSALLASGFQFAHSEIDEALAAVLAAS